MKISGFQKLTLLDFPDKVACIVFVSGCNFRCPFCHNASLVTHIEDSYIEADEIFSYLKKRSGMLDGVVISGGEPTLYSDLPQFIREVKALGFSVKLDTNGTNPEMLRELISENLLDYIAMDIKNTFDKYAVTVGLDSFDTAPIKESIELIMGSNVPYEFRTTVVDTLHNVEDIEEIAQYIEGASAYFLQNFVDSGDVICDSLSPVSAEKTAQMLDFASHYAKKAKIR